LAQALRPWQHVFEPLSGYLLLCERLWKDPSQFSSGWNFGPTTRDIASVATVCDLLVEHYGTSASWRPEGATPFPFYESEHLQLDVTKAKEQLGWMPKWSLSQAIENTVEWYKLINTEGDIRAFATRQIDDYSKQSIF
jgi:CDP-glucose 4,6-dehydratase